MSKLVVFYSSTGNTKTVAKILADKTNSDILELKHITGNKNKKVFTLIPANIKIWKYDCIILCTPVWWETMCSAVKKFLNNYNIEGKNLYLVATHGGKVGHTFEDMKELTNANVKNSLDVFFNRDGMVTDKKQIETFIEKINKQEKNTILSKYSKPQIHEIEAKSALHKINNWLPFKYDLNIYRGCEHGCKYCFALYSNAYLGSEDHEKDIYIKTNIVEQLEKEISKKSWQRQIINIGGVTDSYQPIEQDKEIMRDVLKVLIKYKTPCVITTKSELILRDADLLSELADITYVCVTVSITTMNERIADLIEPKASVPSERLRAVRELKKINPKITTGVLLTPIMPYITANRENVEEIFKMSSEAKVDYMATGYLTLRGKSGDKFFSFLRDTKPSLIPKYKNIYTSSGSIKSDYEENLKKLDNELREKYKMKTIEEAIKENDTYQQLSLDMFM